MTLDPKRPPKVGDVVRIVAGPPGHPNNHVFHVRGMVDGRFVLAEWGRRRRAWLYRIESPWWWQLECELHEMQPTRLLAIRRRRRVKR